MSAGKKDERNCENYTKFNKDNCHIYINLIVNKSDRRKLRNFIVFVNDMRL